MTEELATRIALAARPKGKPADSDFSIEKLPKIQVGANELQTLYGSLNPYMRGRMDDKTPLVPNCREKEKCQKFISTYFAV